jgi:hypothetical protein
MMFYLGIDENGLGFTGQSMLGPLIVTGTGFYVDSLHSPQEFPLKPPFTFRIKGGVKVCDSKQLFKSSDRGTTAMSSYRLGERTSLNFLSMLTGKLPQNFDNDVLDKILLTPLPCFLWQYREPCFFESPLGIPLWEKTISINFVNELKDEINRHGIEFIFCKCVILCPQVLYGEDKYRKEAQAMGSIIAEWEQTVLQTSRKQSIALLGRIKNYSDEKIWRWWREDGFPFSNTNIKFITKGDMTEFPISLSSIIGKYIREVFIERINRYFRYYDPQIPFNSGYKQSKVFDAFVEKALPICKKNGVPHSCLVRDYPVQFIEGI